MNVTPTEDGKWTCSRRGNVSLDMLDQKRACDKHAFIPQLVPLEVVDADAVKGTVTYAGGITNGPGAIASRDLQSHIP